MMLWRPAGLAIGKQAKKRHIIDAVRASGKFEKTAAWRLRMRVWAAAGAMSALLATAAAGTFEGQAKSADSAVRPEASEFGARVDAALDESHAQKAFYGVLVVDAATGETLYELNADHFFPPASNAKIFTTSLAFAELGRDYHFRTTLEAKGPVLGGRVDGDLILVGRGDPDLSNRNFPFTGEWDREGPTEKVVAELADKAIAKGVKEVDGDVVADDSYYPYDPYPEGWTVGDLFFSFGAPVSAINFNDNTVTIDLKAGVRAGDPAGVRIQPAAARDSLEVQVATSASGAKTDLAVVRNPGPNFILLRGTIPVGAPQAHLEVAMTQPAETTGKALKEALEAKGVTVRGVVRVLHSPPPVSDANGEPGKPEPVEEATDRTVLAEHISPPLVESIRLTNKISHNLHAEMLLRAVGREKYGTGSTAAGLKIEREFLKSAGIADGDVVLSDGSGLAPKDLVTPRALVAMLRYAQKQSWGADLASTFPVAGVDGTLEHRFAKAEGKGAIHAKTGGIDGTRALSGYATTRGGQKVVFSILTNDNPQHGLGSTATTDAIAEAMIETLGAKPGPPRPNKDRQR
jgi:D-alanyl-D-alanine carboxypeptidase/D-alanyl-D-alanine-endopeptidase (penicillin-binding protein 4)